MAAVQAAPAILAMAVLQVFQAKMLQGCDQQGLDSAAFKNAPPAFNDFNDLSDLESVWNGRGRLVCLIGEHAFPTILLADERSPGWGCAYESMAQEAQV